MLLDHLISHLICTRKGRINSESNHASQSWSQDLHCTCLLGSIPMADGLSGPPVNSESCTRVSAPKELKQQMVEAISRKCPSKSATAPGRLRSSNPSHKSIEVGALWCTHPFTLIYTVFVKLSMFIPFSCSMHCFSLNPASHQMTFLVLPPTMQIQHDPTGNAVDNSNHTKWQLGTFEARSVASHFWILC